MNIPKNIIILFWLLWVSSVHSKSIPKPLDEVPLFMENHGQYEKNVWAKATFNSHTIWFTTEGIWFQFFEDHELEKLHDKNIQQTTLNAYNVKWMLKGATFSKPNLNGNASKEYYNFYLGKNSSEWISQKNKWSRIYFTNIYPHVDIEFIATNAGLKYNFIVKENGNVKDIASIYEGAKIVPVNESLIQLLKNNDQLLWQETIPSVYFENSTNTDIRGNFSVNAEIIQLDIPLSPDFNKNTNPLIIDPFLVFSTYSGSLADNFGCTGTYDHLGNAYSGGTVFNFGLPVTAGAVQLSFGGGKNENLGYGGSRDAAILKFNSSGNQLLYCTYLGGTDNEQPHSMVVDSQFNLFVMGTTRSINFPVTRNAYDTSHNGDYDFFIACFNSNGTQLLGATYFGSTGLDGVGADRSNRSVDDFPLIYNYADEFRGEIIENQNHIYVGGVTYSTHFPHTVSTTYPTVFGSSNGVMFCMNKNLKDLKWSHVIGTKQDNFDAIYGIAYNDSGIIYGAGGTYSGSSTNADFREIYGTNWRNVSNTGISAEAIIIGLDMDNGEFKSGRYYGTNQYDQAYFVQTDNSGRPYIFGQTEGNMAGINARYHDDRNNGQFIARFDLQLSNIELQSCFGANGNMPNISPSAFLIDECERIFISGWGGNTNSALYDVNSGRAKTQRNKGNTRNLPLTNDAIQRQTDGSDFYMAVFAKDMYDLAFATYFGGISTPNAEAEEHVDGGTSRFDKKGIIYQSLCGGCRQNGVYPVTPGAWSRINPSPNCNNALFKIDVENLNRKPVLNERYIEVIANERIDITLTANDPDRFDTLHITGKFRNLPSYLGTDTPILNYSFGIGTALLQVYWPTTCNSVLQDTLYIDLMIRDCGCPTADTSYTTIKILVKPPPPVLPPDAICVLFQRFENTMRIEWPSQTTNSTYFKYFLLVKTLPDNSRVVIDTIRNNQAGFYIDQNVIDPHLNNYCYELLGVNVCDLVSQAPYSWCSVRSLNSPLKPVHVITTTVHYDKRVDVLWSSSKEPDFKDYEVYKYKKGSGIKPGIPFLITKDTFLSDSSFNVDLESFCYEIVVTDKCGQISNASNPGCNVVLKGTSKHWPDPYFDLYWDDYKGWKLGVDYWVVEKKHDGQSNFNFLSNSGTDRFLRDPNTDYDWGGYEFRVKAFEKVDPNGIQFNATSESNWIYLIQPPEVWVPNAFTTNEDGLNEVWGTLPIFVKNFSMKVYDRWGQKIWESTNKKEQWNGRLADLPLPEGVYAWLLHFDGWDNKKYQKTGTVMILR
jgi:gliding motility-associated-like protein